MESADRSYREAEGTSLIRVSSQTLDVRIAPFSSLVRYRSTISAMGERGCSQVGQLTVVCGPDALASGPFDRKGSVANHILTRNAEAGTPLNHVRAAHSGPQRDLRYGVVSGRGAIQSGTEQARRPSAPAYTR